MFRVRPSHFLSQSFSHFKLVLFSKSPRLIFRVRPSHCLGLVLPTFPSQFISFFESGLPICSAWSFPLFQVSPFHFLSQTFPFFRVSPSHFSLSVLLIFRVTLSHFFESDFPIFSSQSFSLFKSVQLNLFHFSNRTFTFFWVSPSYFSKSVHLIFQARRSHFI